MAGCECCDGCDREVRVLFCPKCESRSVAYVFRLGNLFGIIPRMECRGCGFASSSFPVLVVSEGELKRVSGVSKKGVKKVVKKVSKKNKKVVKKKVSGVKKK